MIPYKRLGLLLFSVIFLSGCWDSLEIEKRGFVTGIAVDLDSNQYKLTQQIINPSSLGTVENKDSSRKPFRNLTQTGETIMEMNRDMVKKGGRKTNVTHLELALFSEALTKEEHKFEHLMDIFLREKEMLRKVKVAIAKEDASKYLDVLPDNEHIPSAYISKLLENKSNLDIAQPITVGDIQNHLLTKRSFIMPLINQVNKTTLHYEGLAIYSGTKNKVVGVLTGSEAKGVNFIDTKNQTGTINININDKKVTIELLNLKSKISLKNEEKNNLQFHIDIVVEAGIAEQYGSLDIMQEENYIKLQKTLEEEMKKITKDTISILQNQYQTDIIGLNRHLYEYHYPLWKSIQDDWEKGEHYFQKSTVSVDVNSIFEIPGDIIKSN